MHAVEIDRVLLVLLAVNFAEILGMKAVLASIPILEGTVIPGDVGIVEVAGIEGRVERGRSDAVEDHIPNRQNRRIADQQHIMGLAFLPSGVQESLELLGVVHAGILGQDGFQDGHFDREAAAAILHQRFQFGLESVRRDDHQPAVGRWPRVWRASARRPKAAMPRRTELRPEAAQTRGKRLGDSWQQPEGKFDRQFYGRSARRSHLQTAATIDRARVKKRIMAFALGCSRLRRRRRPASRRGKYRRACPRAASTRQNCRQSSGDASNGNRSP